jgi:hypothetical protein
LLVLALLNVAQPVLACVVMAPTGVPAGVMCATGTAKVSAPRAVAALLASRRDAPGSHALGHGLGHDCCLPATTAPAPVGVGSLPVVAYASPFAAAIVRQALIRSAGQPYQSRAPPLLA